MMQFPHEKLIRAFQVVKMSLEAPGTFNMKKNFFLIKNIYRGAYLKGKIPGPKLLLGHCNNSIDEHKPIHLLFGEKISVRCKVCFTLF